METARVTAAIKQVAAELILPRFRALARHEVIEKSPGDVVTIADREAEVALTAIFAAEDPGCLVVGEEAVHADATPLQLLPSAERAWVVDPVDGTRNFASGSPDFGVMVAEVQRGVTTRGWIWQPLHDRLYVAERGGGVTCNGAPVRQRAQGADLLGGVQRPWPAGHGVRLLPLARCCAVDYPLLAEGRRDFMLYRAQHPWDHLPGALIVTELGGRVATLEGRDYAAGISGRALIAARDAATWQRAAELVTARVAR